MWNFFEDGTFYSCVVPKDDDTKRLVRTRDYRSMKLLEDYFGTGNIPGPKCTPKRDYLFRVTLDADQWAGFLEHKAMVMQATNYKSEVSANIGWDAPFTHALHDVWQVMYDLQARLDAPRKRKDAARRKGLASSKKS